MREKQRVGEINSERTCERGDRSEAKTVRRKESGEDSEREIGTETERQREMGTEGGVRTAFRLAQEGASEEQLLPADSGGLGAFSSGLYPHPVTGVIGLLL